MATLANKALENLYNDELTENSVQDLEKDQGVSGERFRKYCLEVKTIAKEVNASNISKGLTNLLKALLYDALADYGIEPTNTQIELCVAGSLAREQATAYSDIDCFLILSPSLSLEAQKDIHHVTKKIFNVANKLFVKSNQFCFDPIGISLHRIVGTPTAIVEQLIDPPPAIINSLLSAKSVLGSTDLLKDLQKRIPTHEANYYLEQAIDEFHGPRNEHVINIKSDLFRPLDFILQGLRKAANIDITEFPTNTMLINELARTKNIDVTTKKIIENLLYIATNLRALQHSKNQKESDVITTDVRIQRLIEQIGWLRGAAQRFKENGLKFPFCITHENYSSSRLTTPTAEQKNQLTKLMFDATILTLTPLSANEQLIIKFNELEKSTDKEELLKLIINIRDLLFLSNQEITNKHLAAIDNKAKKLDITSHSTPEIFNDIQSVKAIAQLRKACDQYKQHLLTTETNQALLADVATLTKGLYERNKGVDQILDSFKNTLNNSTAILAAPRDSARAKFLKTVGHIFATLVTLGIYAVASSLYSYQTRGDFLFWKSPNESFLGTIKKTIKHHGTELANKPTPKK